MRGKISLFLLAGLLPLSLAGCSENIVATLTIDPNGGNLIYYPEGSTTPEAVAADDPVFDLSGSYSYTAEANSELPQKIKTLQAQRAGYHFAGWGNVVNGEVKLPYLEDFSIGRMPYSDATYRAVFDPLASVTFLPVTADFEPLVIEGQTVAPLVLSGSDIYVGATLDNTRLNGVLTQLGNTLPDSQYTLGRFSAVYSPEDTSSIVGAITIAAAQETYYAVFSAYPTFNIHYAGAQEDVSIPVAPGTELTPYLPSEKPSLEGSVFEGWYTDADYTVPFYPSSGLLMPTADFNLYAHFCHQIPIEYALPEGWQIAEGAPTTLLTDTIPSEIPAPSAPAGYTFESWYLDVDEDGVYTEDQDVLLNGLNRIPENLDKAVLRPLYSEWDRVYVDLRTAPALTVPSQLADVAEGIYATPLLPGADLTGLMDTSAYTFSAESLRLTGFEAYSVTFQEGETLAESLDRAEQGSALVDLKVMPDTAVVLVPRFEEIHPVTVHYPSGDVTIQVGPDQIIDAATDDLIYSEEDAVLPGVEGVYLEEVLTGWSLSEGGEALTYPFSLDEVTDLYPLYTRHTSLTLVDEAGTTLAQVDGLAGQTLNVAQADLVEAAAQAAYPAGEDGVNPILGYRLEYGSLSYTYQTLDIVPFMDRNCFIRVILRS